MEGDFPNYAPPMRKWRCTHGHKWEAPFEAVGVLIRGEAFGLADGESVKLCGRCLTELLKDRVGQVREDT